MKVIKKWRFDDMCELRCFFWGIEIINKKTSEFFRPTYPFSDNKSSVALQTFVESYEKELLDFYINVRDPWFKITAKADDTVKENINIVFYKKVVRIAKSV